VAFNGSDNIVVFVDTRLTKGIVASRVSPQGVVLDTGYTVNEGNNNPDIASGGGNSLIVWSKEYSGVWTRFVDAQAIPVDTAFCVGAILASSTDPAVGCGGGVYLVAWSDFNMPGGDLDVFSQAVSISGELIGERASIARGDGTQKNPAVAFNGSDFLVAWQDGDERILGRYVGLDGKPAGEPFFISDTSMPGEKQNPAIAAGASRFLTVWAEYHAGFDIYGSVDDLIAVREGSGASKPAVTRLPTIFFSAEMVRQYGKNSFYDACGRRVKPEQAEPGVYFMTTDEGMILKAVRIK
jgi:hypothetical protein